MTSLWFVTPAWQRIALTAVCLEQRKRVITQLSRNGVEAHCVVVADDDNLDTARDLGFDVVEQNNDWLGRKFNDGIEYAARHGADWIVPIGSDSWVDPWYFIPLPKPSVTRSSAMYAAVTADRIGYLNVANPNNPAGPHLIHRSRLPDSLRPAREDLNRFIDSSTLHGLYGIEWEFVDLHPLQYIGFRGKPHLTPYERLWNAWGVRESTNPWAELATKYPLSLVARARECV